MVSRSTVRPSRLLGVRLSPKFDWLLRRRRRPPSPGRSRRREGSRLRLREREERLLRQQYDLRGRQLGRVLAEAAREPGETGSKLIELLEQRLDALVWRAGFASSIHQARLLIRHNHFTVDGSKVDLPSYRLQPGQTLEVRESRRAKLPVDGAAGQRGNLGESPAYLDVQQAGPCATLTREPRRDEVPMPGHLQLVLAGGPR